MFTKVRNRLTHVALTFVLSLALMVPISGSAASVSSGWTEKQLYSFSGGTTYYSGASLDGAVPVSALVADAAGNLYGTAESGGIHGVAGCYPYSCGTVFELRRGSTGWTKKTITGAKGPSGPDGAHTTAGLIIVNGALYGTTYDGGRYGWGTIFKLTATTSGQTTWHEQVIWNFTGNNDAAAPYSTLIADSSGAVYGTYRGVNGRFPNGTGFGGVFKLIPPASGKTTWTELVISTLNAGAYGMQPVAALISDSSGSLYGVATGNINQGVASTIFKLKPRNTARTAWTTTVLHYFTTTGPEGSYPQAGLVMDAKGNLYTTTSVGAGGTCLYRGVLCGTVFMLATPSSGNAAWTVHVLHTFTSGADGGNSYAGLAIDAGGNLYGTTRIGGRCIYSISYGWGVVFKLKPQNASLTSWSFSVLYEFQGLSIQSIYVPKRTDGQWPLAAPIISNGALYGTTSAGGVPPYSGGTVYELTP
jgi:uncharacterized repeat protein (TIGR03803 family)